MSSCRRDLVVFLQLLARIKQSGTLTSCEFDICKDIALSGDEDILEVASSIIYPEKLDEDDMKGVVRFLRNKLEVYYKGVIDQVFDGASLEDAYECASTWAKQLPPETRGKDVDHHTLVYGEVDFDAFSYALRIACRGVGARGKVRAAAGAASGSSTSMSLSTGLNSQNSPAINTSRRFIDLGHGSGRAVIMAALFGGFEEVFGIELLPGLFQLSLQVQKRFDELVRPVLSRPPRIALSQGDLTLPDSIALMAECDVVFANSTCFSEAMMLKISDAARCMRAGARFITFTWPIKSEYFKIIFRQRMCMSWGEATVYIQERISDADIVINTLGERSDINTNASSLDPAYSVYSPPVVENSTGGSPSISPADASACALDGDEHSHSYRVCNLCSDNPCLCSGQSSTGSSSSICSYGMIGQEEGYSNISSPSTGLTDKSIEAEWVNVVGI